MNSVNEKEKKLKLVLSKLNNLNFGNSKLRISIDDLKEKKNQLKI